MDFEEIEHTADRAFLVRGRNLAELLKNAAHAMRALDNPSSGGELPVRREVEIEGVDRETLLVNWLNEILFLEQIHHEVYEGFHIFEVRDNHLRAQLNGRSSSDRITHIKAATFHNLDVKQTPEGFEATVVLDV